MERHYMKMKAVSHQQCQYNGRQSLENDSQKETLSIRVVRQMERFPKLLDCWIWETALR